MEIESRVLLNLKCEQIQETGSPILAETKDTFQIRNPPKGIGYNTPSIHVYFIKVKFH